jgi:murein DD-endopeptidase MepM/ murein hydrolase activator NlpD
MNPIRIRRKWKITYQYGLDGVRKELQLPGSFIAIAVIILACLFILALLYLANFHSGGESHMASDKLLQEKLDYYSGVIDSVYQTLDTLKVIEKKPPEAEKLYPYNMNGEDETLIDNTFVYDNYLDARVNSMEDRINEILTGIIELENQNKGVEISAEFPENGPSIYPTFGRWSDGWGVRMHPIYHKFIFHSGIDFANKVGTPVYATGDGEIIATSYDPEYGKLIKIRHANGYETRYGHLYHFEAAIGDQVRKGQIIALMGDTGRSTGPHLHYEVLINGVKVNPARYLNRSEEAIYYAQK